MTWEVTLGLLIVLGILVCVAQDDETKDSPDDFPHA